jgi:hypothetical protein
MTFLEAVLRIGVAAFAARVVAVVFPASRSGDPRARCVLAGATGVACIELLMVTNALWMNDLVVWHFTRLADPVFLLLVFGGFLARPKP